MATETLEEEKPQQKAPDEDGAAAEAETAEPKAEEQQKDAAISAEVDNSEERNVDDKGQESDQVEEKKDGKEEQDEDAEHEGEEEDEEEEEEENEEEVAAVEKAKGKVRRRGSAKVDQSESKKEKDPVTPASERPTRERKTVERYTVSSPAKFPRSSSSKALSIEKGHGTQLKDIPNVAFKLSKRKPDDNLRTLHSILFGKKAKAHNLKRNIGLFSGYVWAENEEKQRAKVKERIDKCVKEKLVDFCDVLNIPINKTGVKKDELSAKLLEFLESPHATTDILLADKEKKGKKRTRKATPSKSSGETSETPAKKQKQTSQVGKKRKQSSDIEEDDTAEPSDAKDDSQEDREDVSVPKTESDHEESKSEEEEDKRKAHKRTSKKTVKEDQTTPVKKTSTVKAAKSNEKTSKKSTSKKTVTDSTSASLSKSKQSASKKQKTARENHDTKGKVANIKQTDKSSKALVKDQGKGRNSKKAKAEPSREEMHTVVVDILKEVDFNTATLSDILRLLGTHFGLDLMHRKAEVKDIITDVINNMSGEEDGEETENDGDDDADKDDAGL